MKVVAIPEDPEEMDDLYIPAVLDKDGIVQKEASSKGKTTKEFNKDIYEIQSEYGIKKCEVTQKNIPKNARKI